MKFVVAAALLVGLLSVAGPGPALTHYLPRVGTTFSYYETTVLDNGVGNYSGYTENQWINGTERVTASQSNGTVWANYSYVDHYVNDYGSTATYLSPLNGTFHFSDATYRYLGRTDGQSGYTNPTVWFYIDNNASVGSVLYLLNTECNVTTRSATVANAQSATGYVSAIEVTGTGVYERDDSYGVFTAKYTWVSYFDPTTGFVVGYRYTEVDSNAQGDGFTYTDDLNVVHTSYTLTPAPAPASSSSSGLSPTELVVIVAVILLVVVVAIALAVRRRRPALPRHSPTGRVDFAPGPVGPPPPAVGLIPSGQPPVQQIVMRETVKVNCRYCGTLIDSTATVCPNCGAPRT